MHALLFITLGIPAVTAVLLMLFRTSINTSSARWIAVCGAGLAFFCSVLFLAGFQASVTSLETGGSPLQSSSSNLSVISPKVETVIPWLHNGRLQLSLYFGVDGISIALIALTTLLTVSAILISWESIQTRASEFYASLLLLETGLIGVFCAFDLLLFYVFFEMTLIPLFFLIAVWGGRDRKWAAVKFFLYTLAGSLVTLSGLIWLVLHAASGGLENPTSLPALLTWLREHPLEPGVQEALFIAVSMGFLIKVPVFPFHTWLPLAHVEAPTAGSVILAGVLLKLGTYGFLRICLPLFPAASLSLGVPIVGLLSVIGIIYGSLCALWQSDIKKLVAYSSVAHLGFCMLGLFALNAEGITGSVLQMINHGLSTGALFILVGMIYDRYHTREMSEMSGLATKLPRIGIGMVFISMSSIGLPGLNGFVGEFLSLAGMFKVNPLYSALGTTGVILGAWYLLTAVQKVFFGKLVEPHHGGDEIEDMSAREFLAVAPLAALCLWIGVRPQPLIDLIQPDIRPLVRLLHESGSLRKDKELETEAAAAASSPTAPPIIRIANSRP
ncbi:MAG: NuoM family protein [Planctomycetaceae bacterium]